jgi:hypothetical protein
MAFNPNDPALQLVLQNLEVQRKLISKKRYQAFAIIATGILIILGGIFLMNTDLIYVYLTGGTLMIGGFVLFSSTYAQLERYRTSFKEKVIGAALRSLHDSLTLEPEKGIPENEFVASQLFDRRPDRYHCEDQISGKILKTEFYFSEVHAEYKEIVRDNKGRTREVWHDILKGIIFTADFNKDFKGITIVSPNDIGSTIGKWISKNIPLLNFSEGQTVELENVAFNKTFLTQSTDQIEARYILTPCAERQEQGDHFTFFCQDKSVHCLSFPGKLL